jgi:hypothetical protein
MKLLARNEDIKRLITSQQFNILPLGLHNSFLVFNSYLKLNIINVFPLLFNEEKIHNTSAFTYFISAIQFSSNII